MQEIQGTDSNNNFIKLLILESVPMLLTFPQLKPLDVSRTGRKAYNLAFLARSGFDVPGGAVVPVETYEKALRELMNVRAVQNLPATALGKVCTDIVRHFDAFPFSSDLEGEVNRFVSGQGDRWIVRSSSTDEDGNVYSYAGIFGSVADNRDTSEILEAIRQVWKSFWSEEAFLYRELRHRPHFSSGMAVIIQRQIDALASGVVFTRHPVTDENHLVINAHRGTGEELVQGRTTPFSLEIEKGKPDAPSLRIIRRDGEPPLNDEKFLELASLAMKMEQFFSYPLDIEWVFDQKFFFVQARPLTGKSIDWTTEPVSEFICERLTPLSADLFRDYMERHFTSFYRELAVPPITGHVFDIFKGVIYARKEVLKGIEVRMADEKVTALMSISIAQLMEKLPASVEEYRREVETLQAMALADLKTPRVWELLVRTWKLFSGSDPVVKMTWLLGSLLRYFDSSEGGKRFKELFTAHATLEGQSDSERFNNELMEIFEKSGSDGEFLQWLDSNGVLPEPESLREFIKAQGAWSASPFELANKRLDEESAQLCTFLRALQSSREHERWRSAQASHLSRKQTALKEIESLRNEYHSPFEKGGFQAHVEWVLYLLREREQHRKYTYKVTALLRRLFLCIGEDLKCRGFLSEDLDKEDVFHLTLEEIQRIRNLNEYGGEWSDFIRYKKALWEKERDELLPSEFTGFSPKSARPLWPTVDRGVAMTGLSLSRGIATGTARVIESGGSCEDISAEDILVVQNCEPYWALYFPLISGFIAECGGMLSHAAILAREYEIPAVSGIAAATKIIRNGDIITIDAAKGTVTIQR